MTSQKGVFDGTADKSQTAITLKLQHGFSKIWISYHNFVSLKWESAQLGDHV